jgi:hypothetical protein
VVALCGGSMIGTVIVLTAVLVRRVGSEPSPMAAPAAPAMPDSERDPGAAGPAPGELEKPSVLFTEVPFGSFLAMAAVLYLFAEPWVQFYFHLPGG